MSLTSRPIDPAALITQSGLGVKITVDRGVDPPELRIVQDGAWPYPAETLLVRPAAAPLTLFELARVIDRLGFTVHYEELP